MSLALIAEGVQVTEATGVIGLSLALAAIAKQIFDSFNNRKAANEKAAADRVAQQDRYQFDAKMQRLEMDSAACIEDRTELKAQIADVRKSQDECREDHKECRQEQQVLRAKVSELMAKHSALDKEQSAVAKKVEEIAKQQH